MQIAGYEGPCVRDLTFFRMSAALAVQMKGLGFSL
jgi:hypothetical protein